jgi:2-phospho-L-lactate guanylyltransferase (CobY/MobA/RfbA family)
MTGREHVDDLAVVIPLKRVADAKQRLRHEGVVDVDALVWRLARGVIEATRTRPTYVVTEDAGVAEFASSLSVKVIMTSARTLSDAVADAYASLGESFARLVVVHADLADPTGLGDFEPGDGVTLVADRHGLGTNVMALATRLDFRFGYGANSLAHHRLEASRLGLACTVITESPWSWDVDVVEDVLPDST